MPMAPLPTSDEAVGRPRSALNPSSVARAAGVCVTCSVLRAQCRCLLTICAKIARCAYEPGSILLRGRLGTLKSGEVLSTTARSQVAMVRLLAHCAEPVGDRVIRKQSAA